MPVESTLLSRVKAATGGDRELGREVLLSLGWTRTCVGHFYGPLYHWDAPPGLYVPHLHGKDDALPDITSSIDAARALLERVLPGCGWAVGRSPSGTGWARCFRPLGREVYSESSAGPSLALIAALLEAISNGAEDA